MRAPFRLGDREQLVAIARPRVSDPGVTRLMGTARFDSLEAWLHTEIRGWTLADSIGDDDFARLVDRASVDLADLNRESEVEFPVTALLVTGRPR